MLALALVPDTPLSAHLSAHDRTGGRFQRVERLQDAKGRRPEDIATPFCEQARAAGDAAKFPFMPEDDIAVVVSYVLPA